MIGHLQADGTCAQCDHPIVWAEHAITTNPLALDPDPDAKATLRIVGHTQSRTPKVQGGPSADAISMYRYRQHRCPPMTH